jgi:hypothetical protein
MDIVAAERKDCASLDHIENYVPKALISLGPDSASSLVDDSYVEKHGGASIMYEEKTSTAAWLEALVCIGVNTSCAFMWTTCAGAPNVMSEWMEVSLTRINWLSNASAICNTVFSLLTAWVYEKFGIKASVSDSSFIGICKKKNSIGTLDHCLCCLEYIWMLDKMYRHTGALRKKIHDCHVGPVHCKHRRTVNLQVGSSTF